MEPYRPWRFLVSGDGLNPSTVNWRTPLRVLLGMYGMTVFFQLWQSYSILSLMNAVALLIGAFMFGKPALLGVRRWLIEICSALTAGHDLRRRVELRLAALTEEKFDYQASDLASAHGCLEVSVEESRQGGVQYFVEFYDHVFTGNDESGRRQYEIHESGYLIAPGALRMTRHIQASDIREGGRLILPVHRYEITCFSSRLREDLAFILYALDSWPGNQKVS